MNEPSSHLGPLMKAARKFRKFNQADVARAIGCSQSALSKMEHNLLVPSAPQWFRFVRFTSIPPESLETGIIDRHLRLKFNDQNVSRGFKIPKRYRHFRAQKVRELYPFLRYLELVTPGRGAAFIESTEIEPEFFLDFDNLLGFQVILDLLQFLREQRGVSASEVHRVVSVGQDEIYWDNLGVMGQDFDSPLQVATEFAREQVYFQSDFDLSVEPRPQGVFLTYLPGAHLKELQRGSDPELKQALNDYRRFTLESLLTKFMAKVELLSGDQKDGLGAQFLISSQAS